MLNLLTLLQWTERGASVPPLAQSYLIFWCLCACACRALSDLRALAKPCGKSAHVEREIPGHMHTCWDLELPYLRYFKACTGQRWHVCRCTIRLCWDLKHISAHIKSSGVHAPVHKTVSWDV